MAERKSKRAVDYSIGGDVCGSCTHYEDGTCELVAGMIEPYCWCKLFDRIKDQHCDKDDDGVHVYVIAKYGKQ